MSAPEITCAELWAISTSESRLFTFDFGDELPGSEVINAVSGTSGSVTLGVTAAAAITVGTPAINVGAISYTDADGETITIAIGKAVQVRLSAASGVAGTTYDIECKVATDGSNRLHTIGKLLVVE